MLEKLAKMFESMTVVVFIFYAVISFAQEAPKEHKLAWDPNPPGEMVTGYRIYLDGVKHGEVSGPNTTEYTIGIGPTVPPGCWTVTAFNALESDHSEKVCRYAPLQSAGLRLEVREQPTGSGLRIESQN